MSVAKGWCHVCAAVVEAPDSDAHNAPHVEAGLVAKMVIDGRELWHITPLLMERRTAEYAAARASEPVQLALF